MRTRRSVEFSLLTRRIGFVAALLVFFAACAEAENEASPPETAGPDASTPGASEAGVSDGASDADGGLAERDGQASRCSGDFCLVDLPNPALYGLSQWIFAGVKADPQIGVWAIANGTGLDVASTTQILRLDGDTWKAHQSVEVTIGATSRSVRLVALAGNGSGKLLAVGSTREEADPAGVVVRGDGTTFGVDAFESDLRGAWYAAADQAWMVGGGGRAFRTAADGGWQKENVAVADYSAVWGSGPGDVYLGGSVFDEEWGDFFGYVAHRTARDGGAATWSYETFKGDFAPPFGTRDIGVGVGTPAGGAWWSADRALAHTDGGDASSDDGTSAWTLDTFRPPIALRGFWARAKDDIWAVGDVGRIYHYDGSTWTDARLVFNGAPLTANLTGISGTDKGELFIVGEGVALRKRVP